MMVSNNCGVDDKGLGIYWPTNKLKMISSYVGKQELGSAIFVGRVGSGLSSSGLLERIRAGGAGIPYFYPNWCRTLVAEGVLNAFSTEKSTSWKKPSPQILPL